MKKFIEVVVKTYVLLTAAISVVLVLTTMVVDFLKLDVLVSAVVLAAVVHFVASLMAYGHFKNSGSRLKPVLNSTSLTALVSIIALGGAILASPMIMSLWAMIIVVFVVIGLLMNMAQ